MLFLVLHFHGLNFGTMACDLGRVLFRWWCFVLIGQHESITVDYFKWLCPPGRDQLRFPDDNSWWGKEFGRTLTALGLKLGGFHRTSSVIKESPTLLMYLLSISFVASRIRVEIPRRRKKYLHNECWYFSATWFSDYSIKMMQSCKFFLHYNII